MSYKIPIDLERYGWSETMINYMDTEDNKAMVALFPDALLVFSKALEAREKYLTDEYEKALQAYSVKNVPGQYIPPASFSESMRELGSKIFKSALWFGGGFVAGSIILK